MTMSQHDAAAYRMYYGYRRRRPWFFKLAMRAVRILLL
jgi:hypothetical protein